MADQTRAERAVAKVIEAVEHITYYPTRCDKTRLITRQARAILSEPERAPEPTEDRDYMCPNCVTPWKCNGPHIPEPTKGRDEDAATREGAGLDRPTSANTGNSSDQGCTSDTRPTAADDDVLERLEILAAGYAPSWVQKVEQQAFLDAVAEIRRLREQVARLEARERETAQAAFDAGKECWWDAHTNFTDWFATYLASRNREGASDE